jgi:hypothetical protein
LAWRIFNAVDISEILIYWRAGRPIVEIARSLGVDHNTVRKYTAAVGTQPSYRPPDATG